MRRQAFTLTELLVGLALFFVVSALVFPYLATTHDRRHPHGTPSCGSQLKQIALGTLMYATDYDDRFPVSSEAATWRGRQEPYVKNTQIYQCPQDTSVATLAGVGCDAGGFASSYMANLNLCPGGRSPGVRTRDLDNPARTVLQLDYDQGPTTVRVAPYRYTRSLHQGRDCAASFRAGTIVAAEALRVEQPSARGYAAPNHLRHTDGLVCSFADGHVTWRKQTDLANGGSPNADGLFNVVGVR